MKLIPVLSFVALLVVCCDAAADPKPTRPTVCEDFAETTVVDRDMPTGKRRILVCYGGKKPRLFTFWTTVEVESPDGVSTYAVGG
jgi:hypothetical protein